MTKTKINDDLISAAKQDDIERMQALVDQGADVNYISFYGDSALSLAAMYGKAKAVQFLLEHHAFPNRTSGGDRIYNPLYFAISGGHIDVVRVMLSKKEYNVDVNLVIFDSQTLLKEAADRNNLEMVNLLITAGARIDSNYSTSGGYSALGQAAAAGATDIMRVLLKHGANVNARQVCGQTPLYCAASSGHLDAVRLLVNAGADIEAKTMYGNGIQDESAIDAAKTVEIRNYLVSRLSEKKNAISSKAGFFSTDDKEKRVQVLFNHIKFMR